MASDSDTRDQFREYLDEVLPTVDRYLSEQQIPINHRPFQAAATVVKVYIIRVKGGDKKDYLNQPWFRLVYRSVEAWYRRRYGAALDSQQPNNALGLVLIHNTPFQLEIPLTFTEVNEPGETIWLCFPNTVAAHEKSLDWIVAPPSFENLDPLARRKLQDEIDSVAVNVRSIHVNLMTASLNDDAQFALARGIVTHIDKCVHDTMSLDSSRILIGFWEAHLAVEKALKLLIRQRGARPPNSHDLGLLCDRVESAGVKNLRRYLIKRLPTHKAAIRARYGEGYRKSAQQAVANYYRIIRILSRHTELLRRTLKFNDTKFLLKIPPWLEPKA
jgi:HEPN domain-containing protein